MILTRLASAAVGASPGGNGIPYVSFSAWPLYRSSAFIMNGLCTSDPGILAISELNFAPRPGFTLFAPN